MDYEKIWVKCLEYGAIQIKEEFIKFLKLLYNLDSKENCLEIGFQSGGTATAFCDIFKNVYSIDKWNNYQSVNKFLKNYPNGKFLNYDSQDLKVYNKIKSIKFDCIFIDGCHNYDAVKKDFLLYKTLLSGNGIICFHDIADCEYARQHSTKPVYVNLLWEEIKHSYKYKEIIYVKSIDKFVTIEDLTKKQLNNESIYGIGILLNLNPKNNDV